jgi:hypothetical protein
MFSRAHTLAPEQAEDILFLYMEKLLGVSIPSSNRQEEEKVEICQQASHFKELRRDG